MPIDHRTLHYEGTSGHRGGPSRLRHPSLRRAKRARGPVMSVRRKGVGKYRLAEHRLPLAPVSAPEQVPIAHWTSLRFAMDGLVRASIAKTLERVEHAKRGRPPTPEPASTRVPQ